MLPLLPIINLQMSKKYRVPLNSLHFRPSSHVSTKSRALTVAHHYPESGILCQRFTVDINPTSTSASIHRSTLRRISVSGILQPKTRLQSNIAKSKRYVYRCDIGLRRKSKDGFVSRLRKYIVGVVLRPYRLWARCDCLQLGYRFIFLRLTQPIRVHGPLGLTWPFLLYGTGFSSSVPGLCILSSTDLLRVCLPGFLGGSEMDLICNTAVVDGSCFVALFPYSFVTLFLSPFLH